MLSKTSERYVQAHEQNAVSNGTLTHTIRDLWRVEGAYVRGVPVCGIAPLPLYAASRIAAPFLSATLPRGEVCDTQFLHALSYGAPFFQSIAKQSAPLESLTRAMCHNLCAQMRTLSSPGTA